MTARALLLALPCTLLALSVACVEPPAATPSEGEAEQAEAPNAEAEAKAVKPISPAEQAAKQRQKNNPHARGKREPLDPAKFPEDPAFAGTPLASNTLAGGLLSEDYVIGEGAEAVKGSEVSVHYRGTLANGDIFDTSKKRNKPFTFTLGQGRVIKGWDQGVVGMKVGGKRKLVVPADLAYGKRARGIIPADADLTFTIELVEIIPPLPPAKGPEAFEGKPVRTLELDGGVVVEVFGEGTGEAVAKKGDTVSVHYTGTLTDGTVFDTSSKRGKPIEFPLGAGRVIKGWDMGIDGMKVGELRRLKIPADLAYGARAKGKIPANSDLVFTVELMRIKAK